MLTVKYALWSSKIISVFILPSNHFRNWDAQREELTDAQREKEREKERLTNAAARSCSQVRAVDLSFSRSPSPFWIGFDPCSIAPIVISPSRQSRSQNHAARTRLLSNPSASLSSFFSQFDRIWWYFFLGFVCVFVLRNEWYYILVWQPRKCEQ